MDLISRQAAIDAMDECYWSIMGDKPPKLDEKTALYVDLKQAVKRLPTAEKRGKWEIDVDCEYDIFDIAGERTWAVKAKCSECGFAMSFIEGHGVFNYCPNCGARMEESDG